MAISSLYPLIPKEELERAKNIFTKRPFVPHCFAYVNYLDEGEAYIDVYIFERKKLPYHRFVITNQFYLTREEEKTFRDILMKEKIAFDNINKTEFLRKVMKVFPDYISGIDDGTLVEILAKIYYISHNYPQELLYKAGGIDQIAKYLCIMRDCNLDASNIEEMLDLPVKILRMMNTREAVFTLLFTREKRQQVRNLFERYQFLYHYKDTLLSGGQISFLSDMIQNKFTGKNNEKESIFRYLELYEFDNQTTYNQYLKYLQIREKAMKYCRLPLFYSGSPHDERIDERGRAVIRYFDPESSYNVAFASRMLKDREKGIYEYAGNPNYMIRLPLDIPDMLNTSNHLHNCLWSYPELIVKGKTHIVFLCDRNVEDEVCAAIEISNNGKIEQALAQYNTCLTEEMFEAVEEYARAMKFQYEVELEEDF